MSLDVHIRSLEEAAVTAFSGLSHKDTAGSS